MQLLERRRFLNTGRALAPPEIQQHHLAAVAGQVNRVLAVADGKVGSDFVCIVRVRTAIATARKRQGEKGTKGNETRRPHIFIIRS